MAVFATLRADILADVDATFDLPPAARAYIDRSVAYNVPHGKLNRGLAVLECYRAFCGGGEVPAGDALLANVLGWCVEWLQAFFLVADDIMDGSVTRRGQPCFFRLPEIGLKAVNDSLMLELHIYRVLRKYFRGHAQYVALTELFQDVTYTTEVGQLLDMTSNQLDGTFDLRLFTTDALHRIYKYKTSHYSFYLPVALGMRLAAVDDDAQYAAARDICLAMGDYFQAQDDFLDAFGDPAVTGKVGTDIEDGKCTWLAVEALKTMDADDRALLQLHYAKRDAASVAAVKDLYRRVGVPAAFAAYEEASHAAISAMIDRVEGVMPTGAFTFLLAKIYKRDK
jgi:farnesyl diphosphate synthase